MSKIILKGYIEVPDNDLLEIREELPRHIELTLNEKGCLAFNVVQDDVNENIYHVYEEFIDRASFERHQDRVTGSRWGKLSGGVKRHYQINEEG